LQSRDARDTQRAVAPLVPAEGAHILDTSDMTVDEAVAKVLGWYAHS
jgi:cytidylate kinase